MPPAAPPPLCTTCRHNLAYQWILERVPGRLQTVEDRKCTKRHTSFPDARQCLDYERDPGTDDE